MVAVIAGNGLGLGNTSLTQLGLGLGGQAGIGQANVGQYLNAASGNLVLQSADEGLIFDGLPLNTLRTYNSQGQLSGNNGWQFGFGRHLGGLTGQLDAAGSSVTRTDDDGSTVVYAYSTSTGTYQSVGQSGAVDTLSFNTASSSWTWTDSADQRQEAYDATGQLTTLSNLSGGASYSFSYSNGQLSRIVAGDGDTLIFGYNTSNQLISLTIQAVPPKQSTAVTRQQIGYAYDDQGRLQSVTTTLGSDTDSSAASYTTTYTYAGTSDRIASVSQSDGTTVSYTYTEDAQGAYQVTGIITGTGSAAQSLTLSYGAGSTIITDALGNATQYQYNAAGELIAVIAPAVNGASPTTAYTYDSNGNLLTSTDPNGAVISYAYDASGNLLSVEDGAGNTVGYTYDANDQATSKTIYAVAAQGEVGQPGYVAPSGAETTYYVYDANDQLAYTVDPLGNVSENDYTTINGLSELTTSRQYLGATYSFSGASPGNPPTLAQLQAWVASGAVQSTLSQSTRTDYSYDVRGQLAQQTQYDTVDGTGTGVLDTGTVITIATYDAQGRLLQTGVVTGTNYNSVLPIVYTYDGMGRVISKTDLLGNATSYVYTDSASTIVITQANGLTTTQVRNSAGQLVSSTQFSSAANEASGAIVDLNNIGLGISSTSTTSTNANISYQSRQIMQANGTAQWVEGYFVTMTTVNAQTGAVLYSRLYATPLTAAQMTQVTSATLLSMLTPSAGDQISLTVSGSSGQQAQIQYGTTTFTNPDGSGDPVTGELVTVRIGVTQTVQYATPLTLAQITSLGTSPTWSALQALLTSSPNDQATLNAVDNSSTGVSATVSFGSYPNASGSLVTGEFIAVSHYASTGRITAKTVSVTPLTSAQLVSLGSAPTVAQIEALITTSTADQTTLYGYNSNGQIQVLVRNLDGVPNGQNADGTLQTAGPGEYIQISQTNSVGLRTALTTYATPLTAEQMSSLGTAPTAAQIQALITSSAYDYSVVQVYNSQNKNIAIFAPRTYQNGSGTSFGYFVTLTNYNSAGNETSQINYATPLTSAQVASLGSSPSYAQIQALMTPSASDNVTVIVYNAAGQQLAMIQGTQPTDADANSATSTPIQEKAYISTLDSQGRSTNYTAYANTLTSSQVAALGTAPTLAQVQALLSPSPADQISLTIYGANGSVAATVAYQTHYLTHSDGTVSAVSGEFATLHPSSGLLQLYLNPITPTQMALLQATPTVTFLQALAGSGSRETTYGYDSAGRQVSVTDPKGDTSYTLYSADNEVAYTVDADGNVTGYVYDADGRATRTVQYVTPLTASQLSTLGATPTSATLQNLLTVSSDDRAITTIYDAAGRSVAVIDPAGNVTTTTYDGTGQVLATTQYATALTASLGSAPTLSALQAALTTSVNDRTTQTIYDADQRPVATIDAAGYVTTTVYGANGQIVRQTAYATALTTGQRNALGSSPSLSALRADLTTSAQDQTTRNYDDGAGRLVAQIDADGYLTVTSYDTETNTSTATRYPTALSATQVSALTGSETAATLVGLLGSNTADAQSSVTYNSVWQVADDQMPDHPVIDVQAVIRTTADGTVTVHQYNSAGQLLSTMVTPANGQGEPHITTASYDAFGNTLTTTGFRGATTTYTYNTLNQRTEATDALGNSTWYTYDPDGQLIYTVQGQPAGGTLNALGNVTAYSYNASGQIIATTAYAGQLTLNTLAGDSGSTLNPSTATLAQVAAAIAALPASASDANVTTLTTYTADGQVATVTDGDGYQTAYQYNAFGDRIQTQQQTSAPGSALSPTNSTTSTYSYDSRGELIAETDGVGSAAARSTSRSYDAFGRATSTTDGSGDIVQYSYDRLGRQVGVSQVVQGTVRSAQTGYDAFGRIVSQTDALGNVTTYQYDLATHATTVTTPDGVTTHTVRDAYGNTVSVTDGAGNTTAYYINGPLLTTIDASSAFSFHQYDVYDHLIQTTDAAGQVVTYTYDANGQVLSKVVDPTGLALTTSYQYDGTGRELSVTDPAGVVTAYTYDADGNVLSQTQDAGTGQINLTTAYTYDGSGNVLTKTVGSGATTSTTQYVYDALGQLTQTIVDPTGLQLTTRYAYDANGNQVASTDANGNTSYTIYNQANEAVYAITPAGTQGAGNGTLTQNWYDADGRLVATRTYDSLVSTSSLSNLAGGSVNSNLAAGASLAASAATSNDPISYSVYNADGQLRYSVDALGGVTETRYNALGQVAETLAYATPIAVSSSLDSTLRAGTAQAGDIQQALSAAGDRDATARTNYAYYDADGRQVYSITPDLVNGTLAAVVSQTQYDADGRVVAQIVYGVPLALSAVGGTATTASIAQAVVQSNTAATTQTTQTIYNTVGEPVAQVDPNGNVSYTFYDQDGRVSLTVDPTGAVVQYTRDALGRVTRQYAYAQLAQGTAGWLVNGAVTVTQAQALPTALQGSDRVILTTYDAMGRVATVTRYSQVQTIYNYNPATGQDTASYAYVGGDTLIYSYDAASRIAQTADIQISNSGNPFGTPARLTSYFYDADGDTVGVLDADNDLSTSAYDAAGNLVQTVAYATTVPSYERDAGTLAQLLPAASPLDQTSTYYYDALGRLAGSVDADGYVTAYGYDRNGDQLSTTRYATALDVAPPASLDALLDGLDDRTNHQASNTYDSYGELISTQDYLGTVTQYAYDDAGDVVQTTVAAGTGDARTTGTAYDALGRVISTRDGAGDVTTFTYDLAGNRTSRTDALGNTTWYLYDPNGRLIYTVRGITDQNGQQNALGELSSTSYNSFGQAVNTATFGGRLVLGEGFTPTTAALFQRFAAGFQGSGDATASESFTYDLEGNVVAESDGNRNQTQYTYDGFNERTSTVDPDSNGLTRTYTYDALGQLTSEVDSSSGGYGTSGGYGSSGGYGGSYGGSGSYGSSGSGGSQTLRKLQWTYDAFGNVATYTDGDNATTSYAYDNLDQQLAQSLTVSGALRESAESYDAYGRVSSSTDALGLVTRYSYDDVAHSMTVTTPGGIATTTAYNEEGQAVAVTDASGDTTAYRYAADGRLIQTINPDGSTASKQYDAVGNLLQSQDADGHVTAYSYDAAGRVLTQTVDPAGLALVTTYAYSGRGLEVSVTDPTGAVTTYSHDGDGNVVTMVQDAGTVANDLNISTTYRYNELDEVTGSTVSGTSSASSFYSYDALGRLTTATESSGHSASTRYVYDADGNVTAKTDGSGNTTYYVYDEADEPVYTIVPVGATLPPAGAVTHTSYNADGQKVAIRQYATVLAPGAMQFIATQAQAAASGQSGPTLVFVLPFLVQLGAADRVTYRLYNADGNLQYSIDPTGAVTETRYNTLGQVSQTLVYTAPIAPSPALSAALLAGTAAAGDIQQALAAAGDSAASANVTYSFYDTLGRLRYSLSSALFGNILGAAAQRYDYDSDGNLTATTQYGALIAQSQLISGLTTGSLDSYLASATDTRVSRGVYDAAGRLAYTVDALGDVTRTQYDADGRVTWTLQYANPIAAPASWSEADVAAAVQAANPDTASARGTGAAYDGVGNVIQTFDTRSASPTATYTYDERGLRLSATDRDGNTTQYQYDGLGNLVSETGPAVAVASYASDGSYQGVTPENLVTLYQYDGAGHLTGTTAAANTAQARTTRYVLDASGNVIQTIQADPGAIDPNTGLLSATGATPTASTTYDAFGDAVVTRDANGNYAYSAYDADGRLTDAIDGDGYATAYQYNVAGQPTSVTRYAEPVDTSALVAVGLWSPGQPLSAAQLQSTLVASAADRSISTTYDTQGNKLAVTQSATTVSNSDGSTAAGSPVTQYTYDAYGEVTSQSVLLQGTPGQASAVWATSYTYVDALGRKTMTVDPMGYVTSWSYDAFGDVASTTQWATAVPTGGLSAGGAAPALPPAGNPATTGADRVTTYTYDRAGNKLTESTWRSYVDASGHAVQGYVTTTYGYDGENRVIAVSENGQTVTTQFDALGRVVSLTGPQQPVLVGNWQALLAANPALTLSSPSLYTNASTVISYAYDALGNRVTHTTRSTGTSQSVTSYYRYDGAGRLVASLTPLDGGLPNWASDQVKYQTYDANGNLLTTVATLTGNDASSVRVTTSNTYDGDSQLVEAITARAGAFVADKVSTTQYNAFGEVASSGDGVVTQVSNTYDNAGDLIGTTDPQTGELHTYGYDLAGQRVTDTVPLAASVGGTAVTAYTRDLDGRIVAEQAPSTSVATGENAGVLHATYDRWGNVLSATDAAGNTTSYTYNDRNQVVTQTEAAVAVVSATGVSTLATPVKTSAYDAEGNLVAVTDENGHVTRTAVNALGQTTQTTDGAGAVSLVAYDALGNEVADQDGNGNITFKNVDALGRVVQAGDFALSSDGTSRTATWQQAYVLDQDGNRLVSYDGLGAGYLQAGDTTDAALHANYDGYDSQGHVLWSQDPAQRAASVASTHGQTPGTWTQAPTNGDFAQTNTGWTGDPGWSIGDGVASYAGSYSGTVVNQDRVPVVAGQTITGTSPPILIEGPHGGGVLSIYWYDANGNYLSASGGNIVAHDDSGKLSSVTGTAPPGAAFASLAINATNYGESTIVFDGPVTWDYVPPAGATSTGANGSLIVYLPGGSYTQQPANPDFEDGDTGWDKGAGWSIVQSTNTSNGAWVAGFNGDASGYIVNQDRVPVTPGQSITASIQVSLYLSPDGAAAAGAVAIQWFDASGHLIGISLGNVIGSDHRGQYHTSSVTASAPPGAAFASLAAYGSANGIGGVGVDAAVWNYQYIPSAPTGVVQDTFVYDADGQQVAATTADGDTETWQYNAAGQVAHHTDLSGAGYSYTYDASTGALIAESDDWSPTAQGQNAPAYVTGPIGTPNSETLTYDADGQVATQTYSDGSSYRYGYDANGNQISAESTTVDGNGQAVHTLTQSTYDSHNRLSTVTATDETTGAVTLNETYRYDAAGNRREVDATSHAGTSYASTQDAWYTYDGDNRVQIAAGALVNGAIALTTNAASHEQLYDAAGNIVSTVTVNAQGDTLVQRNAYDGRNALVRADYAVDLTTGGASRGVEETITYDADGHALITDQYYALGTTLGGRPAGRVDPGDEGDDDEGASGTDVGGELDSATVDYYDSVGRLAVEQNFGHASDWDGSAGGAAPTVAPGEDATTFGALALQSAVVYQGAGGTAGYDADGDVVAYQYRDGSGRIDQYAVTYLRKDGYLQSSTSGENVSDTPNVRPSTDQSVYDTRGNLVALEQHTQYAGGTVADTVHVFAYDGNGQIIERRDGSASGATLNPGSAPATQTQHYVYVDGQQVAHYDDANTLDVLDQVTAFSSSQGGPGGYVVQGGDTLQSIAQAEYGDASLWYILAQANALTDSSELSIGQRLIIPAVTTSTNSATTFQPYDPNRIVGSTTPNLPTIAPPPPPSHHCNVLANIIVIAVQIAVSAELGTVVGSLAGQLTGDALGVHQGVDLGELAVSAGTQAIAAALAIPTGGASEGLAIADEAADTAADVSTVASDLVGASTFAQGAFTAAATYVGGYAIAKVVGQPAHFSWAGLVASSLSAGITSEVGPTLAQLSTGLAGGNVVANFASGALQGVLDRETSLALGDHHVQSFEQIAEQAAGSALGNLGASGLRAYQNYLQQPSSQEDADLAFDPSANGNGNSLPVTDEQMTAAIASSPSLAYVDPNHFVSPFDLEPDTLSTDGSPLSLADTTTTVPATAFGAVIGSSYTTAMSLGFSAVSGVLANTGDSSDDEAAAAAFDNYGDGAPGSEPINFGSLPNFSTAVNPAVSPLPSVPYTVEGIDPADLALNVPALSLSAYTPAIQPLDAGPIPLSPPSSSGFLGNLSNAYQSLSQNYKASEAQTDAVANQFQSLVNNAESGVDTFRANLTAYGTSHGGSVGASVANDLAAKVGIGEGAALEAIDTASGLVGLAHNVSELANPATYIFDPQSNISRLKTTASALTTLDEVAMAVSLSPQVGYTLAKSYAGQLYQNFQKDPPKSVGRLGFEAGTILAGGPLVKVGEVSDGLNALEHAQQVANRGVTFVDENLGTPANVAKQAARDFESGTTGAYSNISTQQRQVPALRYNNPNPNGVPYVKFDGYNKLDDGTIELIDAKTRLVPYATENGPVITSSVSDSLIRQSVALAQNPGYRGVIEVPTQAAADEAQDVLAQLNIKNISVRVRPQ